MSFIDPAEAATLRSKVSSDKSHLGKIYAAKSIKFHTRNVDHSLVEELVAEGWEEFGTPLKTKTRLRKAKSHDVTP